MLRKIVQILFYILRHFVRRFFPSISHHAFNSNDFAVREAWWCLPSLTLPSFVFLLLPSLSTSRWFSVSEFNLCNVYVQLIECITLLCFDMQFVSLFSLFAKLWLMIDVTMHYWIIICCRGLLLMRLTFGVGKKKWEN